ncbi:hypothetical protein [Brevundimonas sp. SORGH_AS_0993]|uniref:hypothetical protein n=1 Tax=Brevundimonas sp. SORGH_AS_0993 TaxID=3041794 RepID=UPI0027899718|nr:hypothetical protein [Brevundimonas sp. SORGH_AS_0993]MDQ1153609.1 hypothetical protein [Brevundimonas sp. SORGH_AS_0993]
MGSFVRALTPAEAALAREAFGGALRLVRIRLIGWPFARAFVAGRWFGRDWIVWPRRSLVADFAEASSQVQGVLVHELTHVWQAQQGVNLLIAKLKAGDRPASYAYVADDGCRWAGLNIEQQAMVMEHRFHARRSGCAPAELAFYDRLCPFDASEPPMGLETDPRTRQVSNGRCCE